MDAPEFTTGPFWDRPALPLGPRVATPHLFESLAELLAGTTRGGDVLLASTGDTIGRDVPTDLEATYATTVGQAEETHAAQSGQLDTVTAPELVDVSGGSESYRASVLRYLPQPDAPIEGDFLEPPPPPPPPKDGDGDRERREV